MVYKMLRYLYVLDYTAHKKDWPVMHSAAELKTHAHVYVLASQFEVSSLRVVTADRFEKALWRLDAEVADWGCHNDFFGEIVSIISFVYQNTSSNEYTALLELTLGFLKFTSAFQTEEAKTREGDSDVKRHEYICSVSALLSAELGGRNFSGIAKKVAEKQDKYRKECHADSTGINTPTSSIFD